MTKYHGYNRYVDTQCVTHKPRFLAVFQYDVWRNLKNIIICHHLLASYSPIVIDLIIVYHDVVSYVNETSYDQFMFVELGEVKLVMDDFLKSNHFDERFRDIKVVLLTTVCTRTGVVNPVNFIVSEGEGKCTSNTYIYNDSSTTALSLARSILADTLSFYFLLFLFFFKTLFNDYIQD